MVMLKETWRWLLGMLYVLAVAAIWIAASFVVQSVVDGGVSPFLITYVCNSLFIVYIPIVEVGRFFQFRLRTSFRHAGEERAICEADINVPEKENLLANAVVKEGDVVAQRTGEKCGKVPVLRCLDGGEALEMRSEDGMDDSLLENERLITVIADGGSYGYSKLNVGQKHIENISGEGEQRIWTRREIARISLLICPFWFLAQLTFNLSLKYTTVTSNTILSNSSSLFTFLMSLKFLEEKFTWLKFWSVLLCIGGTVIVSLADSKSSDEVARAPVLGDALCFLSALFYATYTTLIRKLLPDEEKGEGKASTALFFGFLGLFNGLLLLPVALILHFTGLEPFHRLSPMQFGVIIGKGLFDNVLSDYLWAKAVLLTTTTAASAGLSIQVPIAALVDSLRGEKPHILDVLGGVFVLAGFFGINQPAIGCCNSVESEIQCIDTVLDGNADKEVSPVPLNVVAGQDV